MSLPTYDKMHFHGVCVGWHRSPVDTSTKRSGGWRMGCCAWYLIAERIGGVSWYPPRLQTESDSRPRLKTHTRCQQL